MAVVINAKGTSVAQFQIGKQGPIVKNNSGTIEFKDKTDTDLQFQILNTANAVNNLTLTGSTTGNDLTIAATGTDTNINIAIIPKGTGGLVLGDIVDNTTIAAGNNASGAGYILSIEGGSSTGSGGDGGDVVIKPGSADGAGTDGDVCITDADDQNVVCFKGTTGNDVNYLEITSAITTVGPTIAAVGTDTNIDIQLSPKGTGDVILGATIAAANSLQGEDDQDFVVKGGDAVAANAGDLILEGGDGDGAFAPGNVVLRGGANGTGTSFIEFDSGVVAGLAAGGDQGNGTINATGFFIDGVSALSTSIKSTATKIASYTTVVGDDVILADSTISAFTITLGTAAVVDGKQQIIKDSGGNAGTNNIIIATEASETIDGASTITLSNDYESFTFLSDGTNWFIIANVFPEDYGSV